MTRQEARLVAEELAKLLRREIKDAIATQIKESDEEYLSTKEAADLLGVSTSFILHNKDRFPSVKFGKYNRYRKSVILGMVDR